MSEKNISVTLKVWRQRNADSQGGFETYKVDSVSTSSSFLEMLDLLNEQLLADAGNDFRVSADGASLRVRSANSASAIWRAVNYDGQSQVTLSWRWKVDRTFPDNAREREKRICRRPARSICEAFPMGRRSPLSLTGRGHFQ